MMINFFLKRKAFSLSLIFAVFFLLSLFFTLKDYGISWDETIHFRRGQAYLHYFLTGKLTYEDLPSINLQGTNGDPQKIPEPRRSFYQSDLHNGIFMFKNDSGHPPLNDELAALSNYIFYQKLGILDDISAHHLFNIFVSSLLVLVTVYFVFRLAGSFAAVITFLSLVTYPLFWSEAHFNIKDPAEVAFFTTSIVSFWEFNRSKKLFWFFMAFIFLGFAVSTKFNIFFAVFIILPFLLVKYYKKGVNPLRLISSIPRKYLLFSLLGVILSLGIFVGSWPYLWQDWTNILKVISYYKEIGTLIHYQPENFYILGFNTFPTLWILLTSPPLILFFGLVGLLFSWSSRKFLKEDLILIYLWFLVPIIRVSIPGSSIYGGVRQILEYLPALAIFSGLGANFILGKFGKTKNVLFYKLFFITLFIFPILTIYKLHPNENVYFNFLIGGLKGAQEKNFPSWGNSFGNAYKQGIDWINKNAPPNAQMSLIQGTPANAPAILLRSDINFTNNNWSGIDRKGEYLMDLTFNDTGRSYNYAWEYVEKFLVPVYELKVDGVPILKIWKNDLIHTKQEFRLKEISFVGFDVLKDQSAVSINLDNSVLLSKVVFNFNNDNSCTIVGNIFVETSEDKKIWVKEKDLIPFPQLGNISNLEKNKATFYFAARKATNIKFLFDDPNSCIIKNSNIEVSVLE